MKFGAVIPLFRMGYFLPIILNELRWLDKIVIVQSDVAWDGDGKSNVIIPEQDNIEILVGHWKDQAKQRTDGIRHCNCDWMFLLDSDEILLKRDQIIMLGTALELEEKLPIASKINTYYGNLNSVALYDTGHTPIVLVPKNTVIKEIRCVSTHYYTLNCTLHHMKFMQPLEDLKWRENNKVGRRLFNGTKQIVPDKELLDCLGDTTLHTDYVLEEKQLV